MEKEEVICGTCNGSGEGYGHSLCRNCLGSGVEWIEIEEGDEDESSE